MRFSHYNTENNLFNPLSCQNNTGFYSDTNFQRSEPYMRLLQLIYKIGEQPYLFQNLSNHYFGTKYAYKQPRGDYNFDQSDIDNQQSQIEIQNIVEKLAPRPELKHKTSIEDRIPMQELNPEVQPTPLSMSILPSQNNWMADNTVRNIDEEINLSIEHLKAMFSLQDTCLMTMSLGYLIKLVTLGSGFHFEMDTILKKFAASYLIASKMTYQTLSSVVPTRLTEILGLDNQTILNIQKQYLVSMNFQLQISKQYLDQIARLLLN